MNKEEREDQVERHIRQLEQEEKLKISASDAAIRALKKLVGKKDGKRKK